MKILSIDCAFSSIAAVYFDSLTIDEYNNYNAKLNNLETNIINIENKLKYISANKSPENKKHIEDLSEEYNKIFAEYKNIKKMPINILWHYCGSILNPGEKLNELSKGDKIKRLCSFLDKLDFIESGSQILIEHQPNQIVAGFGAKFGGSKINVDTVMLENIIHYHFIRDCNVELISAKYKNTIWIRPELCLDEIGKKYAVDRGIQYSKLTQKDKYAIRKLHSKLNVKKLIEDLKINVVIKEEFYDDFADSFLQMIIFMRGIPQKAKYEKEKKKIRDDKKKEEQKILKDAEKKKTKMEKTAKTKTTKTTKTAKK